MWHSGPMIVDAVIESIKKEVPGIENYLSARFLQTQQFIKPMQNEMRNQKQLTDGFKYNFTQVEVLNKEDKTTTNTLFKANARGLGKSRVDQYLFDIPMLDQSNA